MLEVMPEGHCQASSASVCSREEDKVNEVSQSFTRWLSERFLNIF